MDLLEWFVWFYICYYLEWVDEVFIVYMELCNFELENFVVVEVEWWCYEIVLIDILCDGVVVGCYEVLEFKVIICVIIVMLIGIFVWYCEDGEFFLLEIEIFYLVMVCKVVVFFGLSYIMIMEIG